MALTEADKVDVRRFLGYEIKTAQTSGIRSLQFAKLEYQLNNMQTPEETVLQSYLSTLRLMEQEIRDARQNLDIKVAGQFVQNPDEIVDRVGSMRREIANMAKFLGVPAVGMGQGIGFIV